MKETLKKGTRIYYNGDQANDDGLGTITEWATDQFGTWVDIKMDDGRELNKIPVQMFSEKYLGHGGTRFVTEKAYNKFRQAAMDKIKERSTVAKALVVVRKENLKKALKAMPIHEQHEAIAEYYAELEPDHLTALDSLINGLRAWVKGCNKD